jgi:hypothetical protein
MWKSIKNKVSYIGIFLRESFDDREFGDWCETAYEYWGPEPSSSEKFPRRGLCRIIKGPTTRFHYRYGQQIIWEKIKESDFSFMTHANQIKIRQKISEALVNQEKRREKNVFGGFIPTDEQKEQAQRDWDLVKDDDDIVANMPDIYDNTPLYSHILKVTNA